MSDNPLNKIPAADRVSIRGVLVTEGEDPAAALAAAGIINAVVLPVMMGEELDPLGGLFGDGRTPNVIAVLETEHEEASRTPTDPDQPNATQSVAEPAQPPAPATNTLPPAYGMQPLAPVRVKRGR